MIKKHRGLLMVGAAVVCVLALIFTIFTVVIMTSMSGEVRMIFDHPYQVTSAAGTLRTQIYEMQTYLPTMLATEGVDNKALSAALKERMDVQDQLFATIDERYLGDRQDVEDLHSALTALRDARDRIMISTLGRITYSEAMNYTRVLVEPLTERTNEVLMRITDCANERASRLMDDVVRMGRISSVVAIVMCLLIVVMVLRTAVIEQRKNAQIAYQKQLFDLLAGSIDDVFIIYDAKERQVEYVSKNSERMLGLTPAALIDDLGALGRISDEPSNQRVQALFSDGPLYTNVESDVTYFVKGKPRQFKLRLYPVRAQDSLTRYIAVLSDQTEAMAHQQALKDALISAQQANAAKRDFLSRMSHEIRTPMNAIIGMTTIAASHVSEPDRLEDCLSKIAYSSKHLLVLINDVLDMSKIEGGKLPIAHDPFDFQGLMQQITSIVYPQAEEHGLIFEATLTGLTHEWLIGDALRVNQVLLNLLSNAIKFTPAGGSVHLEVRQLRQKSDRVLLGFIVKDTGIGMSKDYLDRMYTPFEQADSSIAQKYGGTGLGLSITKNLVSMMNGTIQVTSAPGQGSTFQVELPFDLPAQSINARQGLEDLRVLVVDDDKDTCEHASLLLKQMGIEACWVQSGEEAVDKMVAARQDDLDYDVCLIDWRMPGIDGVETTRRIRKLVGPDTLIIIISAYDWSPIEQEARLAGANAFIAKPFFASSLFNALLGATKRMPMSPTGAPPIASFDFTDKRILLAEDNALNMEIAIELLRMTGAQVDQAENGQIALDKFLASGADDYDLILMDVQMPVMNGYEATRAIRASDHPRAKTVPIVAMTANAFSEDVSAALQSGMNAHIAKPVDVNMLYKVITPFMNQR